MSAAQIRRLVATDRTPITFMLNGNKVQALQGDTVLTAILTQQGSLRCNEFSGEKRAGFCLMGACQDCWINNSDGVAVRACSTFIAEGMRLRTGRGAK